MRAVTKNLQEYRVRKAYHVIVREHDLIKILVLVLLFTFIALAVWTVSSSNDREIWENSWPQCPMGRFEFMWAGCELTILLYGMRLCYKARSSSWVERWQFTLAVCLEAVVTLSINLVRYSLNNTGSNDALFIATIIQIHLTISINIGAIITPKFLVSSESSRRTLTISGGGIGNSGRAHPSLAKLRDNLINGTVDFAEIPIVDMNPEDIRAELKRVYTQLRMYKLKNLYQDNPHISKRKGGGKKPEKTGKNRRISIPPASSSPKVRRVDELEDEKSDLTVESAPHNIYLSTNKIQLEANDQSVRMSRSRSRKSSKARKCEAASSHASDKELDLKRIIKHHLIDGARQQQYELWELHLLLQAAKKSFQAMETLSELQAPVNICGDIHGQYSDLLRIFEICGLPYKNKYLFLGDYVDRGRHSLEVIILLLALKIQFPKHFFLLRGNHEVRKINNVYGFKDELAARFPDPNDWGLLHNMFNEVFGEMPLAAVVSGKVLCMHGGISPELNSLDDIRRLKRPIHNLKDKLVQDLIWADPQIGIEGFQPNTTRAISVVFGEDAVYNKLKQLDCDIIVRAHQVTEFGHAFFANRKLVTVFSASRYYEEICNWGSVAVVDHDLKMYFKSFKPQEYDSNSKYKKEPDTADDGEE
ncbi:calcineurin-like phosphoesterase domain-containing protein [Ditylenchus destructor]|uniref:Serine/threonine-protein phosphatase n=1 Tax=Ditylenchus destructor TaxID=166010 RepID=A0AAD4MZY6_9BILA|nr:calcineurin-like phosphoesterase domain-containing protein [Ditylenchus destructor]